jgi:hypothetical protein
MKLKFSVGDVCITRNSKYPAVNDGVLVLIEAADPAHLNRQGEHSPYLIRRVDGLPHGSTIDPKTGHNDWFKVRTAWCEEYKLRKPADDLPADSELEEAEQRSSVSQTTKELVYE